MNTLILDSNIEEEVDLIGYNPEAREKLNLSLGKSISGRNALPQTQYKEVRVWNDFRTDD